jgi:signal transduction histidine kinase
MFKFFRKNQTLSEKEKIGMPFRMRYIMATVVIGCSLLIINSVVWAYYHSIAEAEKTTLMRLGGIVNSLALQIDGDAHQHLTMKHLYKDDIKSNEQDSFYWQIHEVLRKNYVANMLHTPIYTIVFDSLSSNYQFGVNSTEHPYFRHAYSSAPIELMEKQLEGALIPMYKDEFGMWLSAFSVIKNKKGEVVALVQADEKFDEFIEKARYNIIQNLVYSLAIFAVILLVLIRVLRPILRQELRDKQALAAANIQISQLDEFRKEMIANVSHDLRTPMSSILGYTEILQYKKAQLSDNEKDKYLTVIHLEAKRMNSMIGELFDLSKLEAGQIVLEKEPFNIIELAQDILYHYDLKAKEKNVRLISEFQDNLPMVEVDIRWIDRVIQNLLDNALKYVNEGGLVKFTVFAENDVIHFKICNTGEPIKQEHLPHIFDRYFKSTNRTSESTGLGLAIVKKVMELHGGKIWAESSENLTTFRFTL